MPELSIHAQPLAILLAQAAHATDVCEPVEAPFTGYDWDLLQMLCQTETLCCDQPVQHLVITSRKGGFLSGNYCFIAGPLYRAAAEDPVASLEIHFGAYLAGPEIYVQSLRSAFTWRNDYAHLQPKLPSPLGNGHFELEEVPTIESSQPSDGGTTWWEWLRRRFVWGPLP